MGRTYLKVERLEPWLSRADRAVLSNPLREAFAVGSLHSAPNRGTPNRNSPRTSQVDMQA